MRGVRPEDLFRTVINYGTSGQRCCRIEDLCVALHAVVADATAAAIRGRDAKTRTLIRITPKHKHTRELSLIAMRECLTLAD